MRLPSIETPLFTIPFFPDSVRSGDILFFSSNIKDQFFNNLNAFIYVVLKQEPDLPWNAIDNFGTYYQFSLPFVLLGLFLVIKRSFIRVEVNQSNDTSALSSQFIYFMFLSGLIIGILTGLIIASVNVNRINIIFYFIVFLIALSVYEIIKSIRSISFVILPLYFLCFIFFCHYYYGTWAREIGPYYFSGMADALKEAKKIDTPRYYITVNSQGNGAKAVSEILTLFHHRIDAKYYQGVEFGVEEETLSADTIAGNKYALPYTERYRYVDPSVMLKNPQEKAVYIVNSNERSMFSTEYFKILDFEGYALVVPYSLRQ